MIAEPGDWQGRVGIALFMSQQTELENTFEIDEGTDEW